MKILVYYAAMAALFSTPALAAPGESGSSGRPAADRITQTQYVQTDNAADDACFGQGRAWYAEMLADNGTSNGYYISQRKENNPAINDYWISVNCR